MKAIIPAGIFITALLLGSCCSRQTEQYGAMIPKDTANKMIQSYLNSIDSAHHESEQLYSLIVDAGTLRAYLGDTSIKELKVMFAHTLNYINAGNENKPADGLQSGAITIIFGGYDQKGNYIFAPGERVPDNANPCPPKCPQSGTAQKNLLE